MKILYIINSFTWGGAEKLVFDLATAISNKVDHVGVMALYPQNDATEKEMCQSLNSCGIDTIILNKRKGKDWFRTTNRIRKYIVLNKIDLIHAHCSIPMLFAKLCGLITFTPVVCTIHSTKGYSPAKEILTSLFVKKYISICDAAEKYMISKLKIPSSRIIRIYNAIDVNVFLNKSKNNSFWLEYGGKKDDIVILNVSRISPPKNLICILKGLQHACSVCKQRIRVYFLGEYDENDSVYRELIEYINVNQLNDFVCFLGKHKNVSDFLINSNCFVMTSFYEGMSVAFLEAVISGVPIIVTDLPFVHELNSISHCAKIIQQNDFVELGNLIAKQSFEKQDKNTINKFAELFSLDRFVSEHLMLYKIILEK